MAKHWWFVPSGPFLKNDCHHHVEVMMDDGTTYPDAHWASDMSGEEQPPFRGWFIPASDRGYTQIKTPQLWRDKQ